MLKYVGYDIVFREIPDEVTLAVNISGCPNGCKGCHSAYLQQDIGEELTSEAVETMLQPNDGEVTCICFMGGDADPEKVAELAQEVKKRHGDTICTAWYSGRPKLPENFPIRVLDYVKVGPYIASKGPLDNPNTNQRLYKVNEDGTLEDITAMFWRKGI